MSLGSIIGLVAIIVILGLSVQFVGNNGKLATGINYLKSGQTSLDYRKLARQDAIDNQINPDWFVTQIQVESGYNPNAISPAGAIGIAQIMPSTAAGWNVDPHDPVASLASAASAMAQYQVRYQSYAKALSAYNAGTASTDSAIARCGVSWRTCVPAETNRYIRAVMGV